MLIEQAVNHSVNIKVLMVKDDKVNHLIDQENDEKTQILISNFSISQSSVLILLHC